MTGPFYINSNKVTEEGLKRINSYASAGHIIGNHTHSHPSADRVLKKIFIEDFHTGNRLLQSWGFQPTYFRYPYLHRGKTVREINELRATILKEGYEDGFVTIDNYDWYLDLLFQKAKSSGKTINLENLRKIYVETLFKGIVHYDKLALKVYNRSPNHVMLLHENDLAAFFVSDLIVHLKAHGWSICHPKDSYKDQDLIRFPSTVKRHGQGRIVAHATEKDFPKPLTSGLEDEQVLDDLWKKYQVESVEGTSNAGM